MVWIIDDVTELATLIGDVATADPLSLVLLLVGGALIGAASLAFGGLALGAAADLLTPSTPSPAPAERRR